MSVYNSTMSTHSSIGFNIGRCHYIRSKKMVSKTELVDTSAVNFYEVIVPQVDVSLHYFTAVQDQSNMESEDVTFQSLNTLLSKLDDSTSSDLDKLAIMINNSSVMYDCALCNRNFTGPSAYESAINHFSDLHKSEQMVLCYKCGVQYDVEVLTEKRWAHNCVPKE
uniref:C2H2-type domain-containing protein n=3 Tax=Photinus pyralis TaxID=7054 RepID=A0A1Y1LE68_PHOPY